MSANVISAAPPAAKWAASAATADGATGPSNGQPKAAAIDTVTGTDVSAAKAMTSSVRGGLSAGGGNVYVPGADGTLYAFGFTIEK